MKFLLPVLLSPWLLIPSSSDSALVFAPRPGSSATKQFDFEIDFSRTTWRSGAEASEFFPGGRLATSVGLTDEYTRAGNGRPLDLLRSFGKLRGRWFDGLEHRDIRGFWVLSDCDVRFEWQPESESYAKTLKLGSVSNLPIDDLVEDADLRGLLPTAAVREGSKWIARGRPAMDALFGTVEMGLLGIRAGREESLLRKVFLRPLLELGEKDLKIDCVYEGSRDPEHPELAYIGLRLDQTLEVDITNAVDEYQGGGSRRRPLTGMYLVRWIVKGPGTLVWNVTEGRFESFELALQVKFAGEARSRPSGAADFELESSGTAKWSYTCRRTP